MIFFVTEDGLFNSNGYTQLSYELQTQLLYHQTICSSTAIEQNVENTNVFTQSTVSRVVCNSGRVIILNSTLNFYDARWYTVKDN